MTQTAPDPESFLPLPPATFHILLTLAGGDRHGYGIMQEVEQRTKGALKLGPGTLYGSLKKLLESGLVVEVEAHSDPALNEERRRYYRLTELGERVARYEAQRLASLVDAARQQGLLGGKA